jgi:energy-coupling factor transporter ATP-binding protein EcfA2
MTSDARQVVPHLSIASLTFSDGSNLNFKSNDIVVFVGPNNAGKSAALNGIWEKSQSLQRANRVIKDVELARFGDEDDVIRWLERNCAKGGNPGDSTYSAYGNSVGYRYATERWRNVNHDLEEMAKFFIFRLSTEDRLSLANAPNSIAITTAPLTHPIHYLYAEDKIEQIVSDYYKKAFNEDLIVHRHAGSRIPLYTGQRPQLKPGQNPWNKEYLRKIEALPELASQGDGMRAFVGILLHSLIAYHTVLLIDEPEAFLHPPQARMLGKFIASETSRHRQIFISTHSSDFLKGLLEADTERLRIIRIHRIGEVNEISELNNEQIKSVWADSLLRYSNVLDAIFHKRAVICESDSDSRFYSAVSDCVFKDTNATPERDLMFINCGGKDRFPTVIKALHKLGVPLSAVLDFDILNSEDKLKEIVECLGGDWNELKNDFRHVKHSIEEKKPELNTQEVTTEINKVLSGISEPFFPADAGKSITKILRRSSPWATAKTSGTSFIPNGGATQSFHRLRDNLRSFGVFIVEVGEIEGFVRTVGGHGPAWVNEVLSRPVCSDPELALARAFVRDVLTH